MKTLFAAGAILAASTVSALAWGDMYMGDTTNNPNSNMLQHSYHAPNYCPAGLQPVMAGGVICCGTPNAGPYVDRAGRTHRPRPVTHRPAPPRVVVGEKGVVYR